jgi:hypothetical protein
MMMPLFILFAQSCKTQLPKMNSAKNPPSHKKWDMLLKKHVQDNGLVDYKGFGHDSSELNKYLQLLSTTHPRDDWEENEKMAYWINAYNAFTVKLIVDHYPVESIKEIKKGIPFVNSVWGLKFIQIEGETYDLNNIEHGILRKYFPDARVHAAINCASISCPPLRSEAFVASKLDQQLEESMHVFINDPMRNKVSTNKAEISKIFSWFGTDFKSHAGSVRSFINLFANEKVSENGKISYLDYNWQLNDIN